MDPGAVIMEKVKFDRDQLLGNSTIYTSADISDDSAQFHVTDLGSIVSVPNDSSKDIVVLHSMDNRDEDFFNSVPLDIGTRSIRVMEAADYEVNLTLLRLKYPRVVEYMIPPEGRYTVRSRRNVESLEQSLIERCMPLTNTVLQDDLTYGDAATLACVSMNHYKAAWLKFLLMLLAPTGRFSFGHGFQHEGLEENKYVHLDWEKTSMAPPMYFDLIRGLFTMTCPGFRLAFDRTFNPERRDWDEVRDYADRYDRLRPLIEEELECSSERMLTLAGFVIETLTPGIERSRFDNPLIIEIMERYRFPTAVAGKQVVELILQD